MGIEKLAEEAAGAFAADKALEAVDPDAGLLAKGAAAIAGFEGVSKLTDLLGGEKSEEHASENEGNEPRAESGDDEQPADQASDDQVNQDN